MRGLIGWFAGNTVAANLLMILIIAAGGLAMFRDLRRELVPNVTLDMVTVAVPYPGATPAEVEEGIVQRVEEAIWDLEGIDKLTGVAAENVGTVVAEVADGYNVRDTLDDIKTRVDAIATFPEETERPIVETPTLKHRVLGLAVTGDLDETVLRELAERVRDDLLNLPKERAQGFAGVLQTLGLNRPVEITQVDLMAVRDHELSIEVSEAALARWGLTFDDCVRAVKASSLDLPAGAIKRYEGEVLLRTRGQKYRGSEFADVVLVTRPDGSRLRLGDVARITDGFADQDLVTRADGHPAIFLAVYTVGDQDILGVSAAVHAYVDRSAATLPAAAQLEVWEDTSEIYASRLDTLKRNAIAGLVMVFLILALFLRLRLAFWVSLGIPVSFLGALWVMPLVDASFNMISMFAFILMTGIVVDDAIVVSEEIHTRQEAGGSLIEGARAGAQRVALPVIFAVLTTIIAFVPMLFISGVMGKFFRLIPVVVIGCLTFSLIESLLILPAHLSHGWPVLDMIFHYPVRGAERVQNAVTRVLKGFINRIYEPLLAVALRWRYLTLAIFLAMLALTAGLIGGGVVKVAWQPMMEADFVVASLEMPVGTSAERTGEVIDRIEKGVAAISAAYDTDPAETPIVEQVISSLGGVIGSFGQVSNASGAHLGEVRLVLEGLKRRGIKASAIADVWREAVGEVPDAKSFDFLAELGPRGSQIDLQLRGDDLAVLGNATTELRQAMARYPGAFGITDSLDQGKEELTLRLTPAGEQLGLRVDTLARQVRSAFYGAEAQRIQRGRDEVKVMIRYPEQDRRELAILDTMRIRTPTGAALPLKAVATVSWDVSLPAITRVDRQRAVDISCQVSRLKGGNPDEVLSALQRDFLPGLEQRHPGITWALTGRTQDTADSMSDLAIGGLISLFVMYVLMAVAFKSYTQPALIMTAIPFGIVGAILGHWVLGFELSMLSFFGIVALAGVVVNDSIVLIDAVNGLIAEGVPMHQALIQGGRMRFRAILLTTLTTFFGLTPLMLETSLQAQFLIPMGVSLAFGVTFATAITLVLIPTLYLVLEDFQRTATWFHRHLHNADEHHSDAQEAL